MSEKQAKVERKYAGALDNIIRLHARAIACHCECLGMNAENSLAVCQDKTPPYDDVNYSIVMQKWGLVNEKGDPLI